MEQHRKFYVTPNRSLDVEIIGEVHYHPVGSKKSEYTHTDGSGNETPDLRKTPELHIAFKDLEQGWITLSGDEADTAWENYKKAVDR